jgi:hypothetical protein
MEILEIYNMAHKDRSYRLEHGDGVIHEYVYPKQKALNPNIKRGRLIAAINDIEQGNPLQKGLRDYIVNGLEILLLNSQSDLNGGKRIKAEPFPTATRRSNFHLVEVVYLLNKVISVYGIADLNSFFPTDFPELGYDTINNYIKEVNNLNPLFREFLDGFDESLIRAYTNKELYQFPWPDQPIKQIDFSNEELWIKVLNKHGKKLSS